MSELWRDIPEYEGLYQASNMGNIRSLKRYTTSGRVLKQYVNQANGYKYVSLSKNNIIKNKRVHVLIMQTFNPVAKKPGYDKDVTIDHINGIKTDNRLDNLDWCTQSENQKRAYALGINGKTTRQVIDLDTREIFESERDAAATLGSTRSTAILRVCKGTRSHYKNHHFAYLDDYLNGTIPAFKGAYTRRSSESLWR